jgi:hypothetical protein
VAAEAAAASCQRNGFAAQAAQIREEADMRADRIRSAVAELGVSVEWVDTGADDLALSVAGVLVHADDRTAAIAHAALR